MEEFSFYDFADLSMDDRQKVESILWSRSSKVEFPWSYNECQPTDETVHAEPAHYFAPNQLPGHVMPPPLPMYHCPGPPIVPMLTYPHNVVFSAGGMYVPMVPIATSIDSNSMVSSNLPYHPVAITSGSGAIFPPQPIMMGPMDARFPSCPITIACQAPPTYVGPDMMHDPRVPVSTVYLAPENKPSEITAEVAAKVEDVVVSDRRDLPSPSGAPARAEESESVKMVPENLIGKEAIGERVIEPREANHVQSGSRRSSVVESKAASYELGANYAGSTDTSKMKASQILPAEVEQPMQNPSVADARRPSLVSEASTSGSGMQDALNGTAAHVASVPAAAKPRSWASLLHNTTSAANAIVISSSELSQPVGTQKGGDAADVSGKSDKSSGGTVAVTNTAPLQQLKAELMQMLKNHSISHRSVYLQPRGLTNRANWCYVNATLQALLACPPFYHLMKQISTINSKFWDVSNFPVMKCMSQLIDEFSVVSVKTIDRQAVNAKGSVKADIKCGPTFEPTGIYRMLQAIDYEAFKLNQQEDAEEFLSCILNRLHDEMVNAMKQLEGGDDRKSAGGKWSVTNGDDVNRPSGGETEDDTRWEQVRARNRVVYSSTASNETSPISAVFRGQICCILHQHGQKESATLQPFFTLPLDVQNEKVRSVNDALEQLVSKESLQGYTCTKSNVEVDATQRTLIEELPPVLVLHLKWFHYDKNGGLQKRVKQVDFDIDMELSKDLLSPHARTRSQPGQRRYKLFAVVSHIGVRAIGGHYVVDIFHPGYNCWLRCDDNNITSIPTSQVTKFTTSKVPYLIFYRSFDKS